MSTFKGSMANYYHEARAHVKKLKHMQEDNKRRAERRAELATVENELPMNVLRLDGRPCKLHKNLEQYQAIERMEGLIKWNGQEILIDRWDGRALLDFYREPDARALNRTKTSDELELEEELTFESYRDLVKAMRLGLTEEQGILFAEQENVELRARARTDAAAAVAGPTGQNSSPAVPGQTPAGFGAYSAVAFSYGGDEGGANSGDDDSEDDEEEDEDDDDAYPTRPEDIDAQMDDIAGSFSIDNFSARLKYTMKQEQDAAKARFTKTRRKFSRKKLAQRSRRMQGQGLDPWHGIEHLRPKEKKDIAASAGIEYRGPRRGSPTYEAYRSRSQSRSRSRSRSPDRGRQGKKQIQYITEIVVGDSRGLRSLPTHDPNDAPPTNHPVASSSKRDGGIIDALPHSRDPAVAVGPVLLPEGASTVQGVRPADYYRRRDDERDGHDKRDRDRAGPAYVAPKKPVDKTKETPQERLKRLMQAQLNKQIQKDNVTTAQKKLQEEKEKVVRQQMDRVAYRERRKAERSPSRSPRRSRSRSPRRYRSRSPERRYR